MAAAIAAAIVSGSAHAQSDRLSLAERVVRLEQQVQGQGDGEGKLELLERISQLQGEVAALRNLAEQQGFELENLKSRSREQYLDLDSRIARMEGGGAIASGPDDAEPADDAADTQPDAAPAGPGFEPDAAGEGVIAGTADPQQASGDPRDERRAYESAFDALKEGRYAEAARRFQSFLDQYPAGEYAPNAQYWLGESYYVTQNYPIALDAFQELLARFPDSSKSPDALLKVGYSHYELKNWAEAEAVLNQVIEQYPDTTVARLAQARLRALRLESRE
ncbi:MAG TPA: tol-pal system protein YbgF [Xanthomonadaceae bacterium]|nr:tol-pal system protein YbgF [Xanthomonadaceae bacterium]